MNKKIKLSLLGTLIAGSALAITMPIVSCSASASADVVLTTTASTTEAAKITALSEILAEEITPQPGTTTYDAQRTAWEAINDSPLIAAELTAITDIVTFKDGETVVAWADAVDGATFTTTGTFPPQPASGNGTKIPNVTVTINLKGGYTTETAITFILTELGTVKPTS